MDSSAPGQVGIGINGRPLDEDTPFSILSEEVLSTATTVTTKVAEGDCGPGC